MPANLENRVGNLERIEGPAAIAPGDDDRAVITLAIGTNGILTYRVQFFDEGERLDIPAESRVAVDLGRVKLIEIDHRPPGERGDACRMFLNGKKKLLEDMKWDMCREGIPIPPKKMNCWAAPEAISFLWERDEVKE